jgi:hypothetical protein
MDRTDVGQDRGQRNILVKSIVGLGKFLSSRATVIFSRLQIHEVSLSRVLQILQVYKTTKCKQFLRNILQINPPNDMGRLFFQLPNRLAL